MVQQVANGVATDSRRVEVIDYRQQAPILLAKYRRYGSDRGYSTADGTALHSFVSMLFFLVVVGGGGGGGRV